MSPHAVTLIPGDGVGPEVVDATVRVLEATRTDFAWDIQQAGENVIAEQGSPLPDHVLDSIKRNRVALKGPITTPAGTGFRNVNVGLRRALGLFACVRPLKAYAGSHNLRDDIDLVIVGETSEDVDAGIEVAAGTADAITRSRRIVDYAFDYARRDGRRKVTLVHPAKRMQSTAGLFRQVGREVAEENGDLEFEDRTIDDLCLQLVLRPQDYDVLVLPNLYADIVAHLGAGLVGGLGLAPGADIGTEAAVFEAMHGSAPKYTGRNKVNPMAVMLSGVLLLRHLEEEAAASALEAGIADVLREGTAVTYDLKARRDDPTAVGTSQVADAIVEHLRAGA